MQPSVTRRNLLQTLGALSLGTSGCLGLDSPSSSTTENPSPTSTPREVANCTEPRSPDVPAGTKADNVAPRDYPKQPDQLTSDTVKAYVREFERAYKVNQAIEEYDLVKYDFLSFGISEFHEVETGFVATVGGHVAPFWYQGTSTETTPYHKDEEYNVTYLVSERAVWRVSPAESGTSNSENRELLVCTP